MKLLPCAKCGGHARLKLEKVRNKGLFVALRFMDVWAECTACGHRGTERTYSISDHAAFERCVRLCVTRWNECRKGGKYAD